MLYAIINQKQRERFENERELDTSHSIPGVGRFRVNVLLQRDSVGSVMRVIPHEIVPLGALGMPDNVASFATLGFSFVAPVVLLALMARDRRARGPSPVSRDRVEVAAP